MCWCVEPSSVQSILSISNRTYTILRPNANRTGKLNWLIQSDFYALFTDLLIEHSWFIAFRYPYKFYKLTSTFNKSLFARTNMLSALKLIFCFFSLLILSMYCHLNCCFVDFSPRKVMTNYYWCDSFFSICFCFFLFNSSDNQSKSSQNSVNVRNELNNQTHNGIDNDPRRQKRPINETIKREYRSFFTCVQWSLLLHREQQCAAILWAIFFFFSLHILNWVFYGIL